MKHRALPTFSALLGLALTLCAHASAQRPLGQRQSGNRLYNPYSVQLTRLWDLALPDPVKLIEVGPVTDERKNSFLLLIGSRDHNDYKRQVRVTHWDGFKFATDATIDFLGTSVDTLLAGHFRTAKVVTPVTPQTTKSGKPAKGKRPPPPPSRQIITTEGIYEWNGRDFVRLFSAPTETRLAILRDDAPDQIVNGAGDKAMPYEVSDTDVHPSMIELTQEEGGYVRFGVGAQDLPEEVPHDIVPGVRFAQSFWSKRYRWFIGVTHDDRTNADASSQNNANERLVVYTPSYAAREKSFWAIDSKRFSEDMEESWRSEPLPGHILDVRVGDPKNEGKEGILVLTSENNDKDRHLYFFGVPGNR